jgi:hypothetical protein
MMPASHALPLALQLTSLEARHLHAERLQPDHLVLGLLKLVDIDLSGYFAQIPKDEVVATKVEIRALTDAFNAALLEATSVRRRLRYRLNPQGPSAHPSKGTPPPSTGYADVIARADDHPRWPALAMLICALDNCGEATLNQLKESGSSREKLRAVAAERLRRSDGDEDWLGFLRAVPQLSRTWEQTSGANPPGLSEIWRRLLNHAQVRISPDGALHATRAKHTILKAPASARAEWADLFGPQLAGALSQFAVSAKESGKSVTVPVDEL